MQKDTEKVTPGTMTLLLGELETGSLCDWQNLFPAPSPWPYLNSSGCPTSKEWSRPGGNHWAQYFCLCNCAGFHRYFVQLTGFHDAHHGPAAAPLCISLCTSFSVSTGAVLVARELQPPQPSRRWILKVCRNDVANQTHRKLQRFE